MANETKYGVISDVHQDPRIVPLAIDVLKRNGAEKLLINGDIGNHQKTLEDSQNYVAFILDSIGKSGLESYVQPGSHETLLAFGPVLDYFAEKYENIFSINKPVRVENKDHHLIFLPGSDFSCGGEYQIGNHEQIPSGKYIQTEKGLIQFEEFGQYVEALQKGIAVGAMQFSNMNDLKKLVTNPDKTIVICHVPRKFDNPNALDSIEFGLVTQDFKLGEEIVTKDSVYPIEVAKKIISMGAPVEIKKENRGNEDLKSLYGELGINKAVNGHFHETGHMANDRNGNYIPEGKLVNELFWNSGWIDAGQTGILTINDDKVSYQNIQIKNYI